MFQARTPNMTPSVCLFCNYSFALCLASPYTGWYAGATSVGEILSARAGRTTTTFYLSKPVYNRADMRSTHFRVRTRKITHCLYPNQDPNHLIQDIDFTNCQTKNGQMSTSTLDNFMSNDLAYNCTVEAGVIHSGDNPSTHSPIFVKLKLVNIDFSTEKLKSSKRINWSKASKESKQNYISTLNGKLSSIHIPECVQCDDMH